MNTIVVVYPYKFLQNHSIRFELDKLSRYVNIIVWDLGVLLNPKYVQQLEDRGLLDSSFKYIKIKSFKSLINHLYDLKGNILFFQCIRAYDLKSLIIFNLIGLTKHKFIVFENSGISFIDNIKKSNDNFIRFKHLIRHKLTINPNYFFISGTFSKDKHLKNISKKTHLIKGSCWEYSNSLHSNFKRIIKYKYAVLVDGAGPKYADDRILRKDSNYAFTSDVWYPSLANFLKNLEIYCGIKVVIAAHPKSNFSRFAKEFDNRPVYHGETENLIKFSEFIVTRQSTASSFAILYNKPIIHIFSNQLKKDIESMKNINIANNFYGGELINIDDKNINYEIIKRLNVNELLYDSILNEYITSSKDKPNFQILLQKCFGFLDSDFKN